MLGVAAILETYRSALSALVSSSAPSPGEWDEGERASTFGKFGIFSTVDTPGNPIRGAKTVVPCVRWLYHVEGVSPCELELFVFSLSPLWVREICQTSPTLPIRCLGPPT